MKRDFDEMSLPNKYLSDGSTALVECAVLLGARISWQDKMRVAHAMRAFRIDMESMVWECEHLDDTNAAGEPPR